ncbi:universal stress protein [Vibrio sp. 10N.286.49.C2]|uniref:universal stress protein n=1 Tax=unclassified Vibrio TaxID=2614977 RepID=UPI000C8460BF|nr:MULTISPECIES: universal stress protein [unclassified Vibrio]PMH27561.1 universal stress protein [Vibrio sp. 10N.286.49.C2]PMH52986.1 universal stress protein [Vibrio sp. 10N.286.49.B1]PMH79210.1 universal stress protein [Vibrio sp. 10N.286.48.B7]
MYKQILVPVDLNDKGFSDKAVEIAVWHAKHSNAEIHILNVLPGIHMSMVATYFPKDAAAKMKSDVKAQLKAFANQHIDDEVIFKVHVAEGKPYATILDYAERLGADLIVMPSHKRSKIDKVVLGSVASKVVQNSPINVLVVKPQSD